MSAAEARQVLRTLLRAVNRNITSATGNRTWRDFVIAEFRRGGALGSSDEQRAALQEARDYAVLIESVHGYKELLLSYNIGIPIDQREKDMNVRAANLVGLQMPAKTSE